MQGRSRRQQIGQPVGKTSCRVKPPASSGARLGSGERRHVVPSNADSRWKEVDPRPPACHRPPVNSRSLAFLPYHPSKRACFPPCTPAPRSAQPCCCWRAESVSSLLAAQTAPAAAAPPNSLEHRLAEGFLSDVGGTRGERPCLIQRASLSAHRSFPSPPRGPLVPPVRPLEDVGLR